MSPTPTAISLLRLRGRQDRAGDHQREADRHSEREGLREEKHAEANRNHGIEVRDDGRARRADFDDEREEDEEGDRGADDAERDHKDPEVRDAPSQHRRQRQREDEGGYRQHDVEERDDDRVDLPSVEAGDEPEQPPEQDAEADGTEADYMHGRLVEPGIGRHTIERMGGQLFVVSGRINGKIWIAVNAHLAAWMPNFRIQEIFDEAVVPLAYEVVRGTPRIVDGYLEVPSGPGLGLELDEAAVQRYRVG